MPSGILDTLTRTAYVRRSGLTCTPSGVDYPNREFIYYATYEHSVHIYQVWYFKDLRNVPDVS